MRRGTHRVGLRVRVRVDVHGRQRCLGLGPRGQGRVHVHVARVGEQGLDGGQEDEGALHDGHHCGHGLGLHHTTVCQRFPTESKVTE